MYSSPKNGYILPKAQYKEKCADIKTMIKREVDDEVCKLYGISIDYIENK